MVRLEASCMETYTHSSGQGERLSRIVLVHDEMTHVALSVAVHLRERVVKGFKKEVAQGQS